MINDLSYEEIKFPISKNDIAKIERQSDIFIIFLDSTKLKIVWKKITAFFKRCVSIIL